MAVFTNKQLAVGGLLVAGAAYLVAKRAGQAAGELADQVNPLNPDNWFARKVNEVVDRVDDGSDNQSNSLGTWLYSVFNDDPPI